MYLKCILQYLYVTESKEEDRLRNIELLAHMYNPTCDLNVRFENHWVLYKGSFRRAPFIMQF